MEKLTLRIPRPDLQAEGGEALLSREWLVTNGLGGYASGTLSGVNTRRYHGVLVAALPAPWGRMVMMSQLSEELRLPGGQVVHLGGQERVEGQLELPGAEHFAGFELQTGMPVWRYQIGDFVLEKRIVMPHLQNTTHVTYRLLAGPGSVRLRLRPAVHFRSYEDPVSAQLKRPHVLTASEGRFELSVPGDLPPLRLLVYGAPHAFVLDGKLLEELHYRIEHTRGYDSQGSLWSPGYFRTDLAQGEEATLMVSTESWETVAALRPQEAREAETARHERVLGLAPPQAREGAGSQLVLAADQFIITPAGRPEEEARARAAGDEVRTVIAGYHWFTDWGRDTMISLDGLTLATGRHREAGYILRTFAHYVRDGLIPNMFPNGSQQGLYHTADATLWFFHAVDRFVDATGDRKILGTLLPRLRDIIAHHQRGTRFGIGVDPEDGLLTQGAEGYQLTWMDAKVNGWVVTPRRGKAVEINALWYNALRLVERWVREESGEAEAREYAEAAERARASFNRRFWYEEGGYLYDVVDGPEGDDPKCRPNQIFSISLPNPVLERERWEPVLAVVHDRLLTPVGLRSLAPGDPDYKSVYRGDLPTRDAAYHQGTVWAWLIGPFVDAWLRVHPGEREQARGFLTGLVENLEEFGVGSIAEIFDADPPHAPRGCIAQAWSVAEVLRCWVETAGEPA